MENTAIEMSVKGSADKFMIWTNQGTKEQALRFESVFRPAIRMDFLSFLPLLGEGQSENGTGWPVGEKVTPDPPAEPKGWVSEWNVLDVTLK
jgi:hypothetical protein